MLRCNKTCIAIDLMTAALIRHTHTHSFMWVSQISRKVSEKILGDSRSDIFTDWMPNELVTS